MHRLPSLRASDSDRERAVERLRHAAAEGRITTDELEQRLGAASAARTYAELDPLLADLPVRTLPSRPRTRLPRWVGATAAVTLMAAVLGMLAGAVRHFAEVGEHAGPLAHAGHLLIAAASMAAVFVAFVVICGVLVWRVLRSRRVSRD